MAAFEGDYTLAQARIWINEFNNSSDIQLLYKDGLVNSLFVIEVIEFMGDDGHERILATPFQKAGGRFVSFNSYHSTFDPYDPIDFKYLIKVLYARDMWRLSPFLTIFWNHLEW